MDMDMSITGKAVFCLSWPELAISYLAQVFGKKIYDFNCPFCSAPVASATCFPQRIEACTAHFPQGVSGYNCAGQCGLCDLCPSAHQDVPECSSYCAMGKEACIATCEAGKAKCLACGILMIENTNDTFLFRI